MIQVSNICKTYGRQVIFDNAGFAINAGERVGLVGKNGHGKTTLFRMILGEEHPDSGVIGIPNDYSIGHLSQHIKFNCDTVLKEGSLSLRRHEDGRDETYKVETILMGLGFTAEDLGRNPLELSGGYQVRLNLSKALIQEPNLLLLDEPTNYLDILSVRWLTQFLRNWKGELIMITHDRDFMDSITTHTMAIHRGKIKKIAGPTEKLYQQIIQEEDIYEQTRINDDKKRKEVEQFINRFRAQANKAKAVQSRIKSLSKKERHDKLSEIKDLEFAFNAAPFTGKRLIETDAISFSYNPGEEKLIDGLSISVGKKDRIAIIGKNGKGKTTLLRILAGELAPLSGTVACHPAMKPAYFGQTNINRLNPQKTIEQEVMDVHPDHNRGAARKICGAMMFEGDAALKKIAVLSGGEKSRVLLGKLLVSPANLLLLDEPTNHLDMESIDSLIEAMDAFEGAVMIVTHSELILHALAERLIVFDAGEVSVFEGSYQDFLDRVGWNSEQNEKGAVNNNGKQDKSVNRKDLRRLRAEIITSRSKVLGQIQGRINTIEETIAALESRIEKDTQGLVEASVKADGKAIKSLSKSVNDAKATIDALFDELESLTSEYETKQKEFDDKLNELVITSS